jgi:hypothetical protein
MRKTSTYTETADNRDKGKIFKLEEMSADQAEAWALKAFFAIMNAGIDVPDNLADLGFAGIATAGLNALGKVDYETARPLLDEMMTCVQIIPDPAKPNVARALFPGDIEEVATKLKLRKAVFDLHVAF